MSGSVSAGDAAAPAGTQGGAALRDLPPDDPCCGEHLVAALNDFITDLESAIKGSRKLTKHTKAICGSMLKCAWINIESNIESTRF